MTRQKTMTHNKFEKKSVDEKSNLPKLPRQKLNFLLPSNAFFFIISVILFNMIAVNYMNEICDCCFLSINLENSNTKNTWY